MHRYRIVHVYSPYWKEDPAVTETAVGESPVELPDALAAITRIGGSIEAVERTESDEIVRIITGGSDGHYNLVRVSE